MMGYHVEYGHLPSRVHAAGGRRTFKSRTCAGRLACRLALPAEHRGPCGQTHETEKARLWPLLPTARLLRQLRSTDIEQLAQRSDLIVVIPEGGKELVTLANCGPRTSFCDIRKVVQMSTLFSRRAAGLASITASGLILLYQLAQIILLLTVAESFFNATQSVRFGLALIAMYVLLLALTALYWMEAKVVGGLGLAGYLIAFFGTMMVAGDWWYETFIGPVLRDRASAILEGSRPGLVLFGAFLTSAAFAVGWLIFGFSSYRAGIFPRGASILMMLGGLVGAVALIVGSQIPLAIAVGWIGLSLIRPESSSSSPTIEPSTG
jgi:hypothetical protein